jgi:hypothetical protein
MLVMAPPPLQHASDADLLRVAGEEPEAFGVLYDRFEADVLAFFWRATQRSDVAADLTAETFAAALESAAGFKQELGSVRNWLFGIARHELADTHAMSVALWRSRACLFRRSAASEPVEPSSRQHDLGQCLIASRPRMSAVRAGNRRTRRPHGRPNQDQSGHRPPPRESRQRRARAGRPRRHLYEVRRSVSRARRATTGIRQRSGRAYRPRAPLRRPTGRDSPTLGPLFEQLLLRAVGS